MSRGTHCEYSPAEVPREGLAIGGAARGLGECDVAPVARDIADRRGGGKTFMRLIVQQRLDRVVNKATASVLLRIMERLPEVTAWRETLIDRQRIEWAALTTILNRCPDFAQPTDES